MDEIVIKKIKAGEDDVCDEQNVAAVEEKMQQSTVEPSVSVQKKCKGKTRKPRLYSKDYMKLGFTFSGTEDNPSPKCLVCGKILANESMVPNKLQRHFTKKHGHLSEKPVEYFIELSKSIKKSASFTKRMKTSDKAQKASYLVAQIIARNKEPHTIAETTIKESCCAIVRTMFGPEFEREVNKIPLADNTIARRIQDMSDDIKLQMKDIFQDGNMVFTLQLDETTDVSGFAQLMVFIRFIHTDRIIEQFLCCLELPERTRGEDIFTTLDCFMKENNLQWSNCVGICTDGAPSMVGSTKGFIALAKKENENIITTHCFLHREALVAQTIGNELRKVMEKVVQMVNYIKSRPLKSGVFAHICNEMGARFKKLLLHTQVRWLSRGRVLCRVYELREMMLKLFEENQQTEFCQLLQNKLWCTKLAYLADIFEHLDKINTSMQGKGENILTAVDKICAMRDKIAIWKRRVKEGNFEMFAKTAECELKCYISSLIVDHLTLLGEKVHHYFPNVEVQDYDWIRNPFLSAATRNFSVLEEEELAEIKNDRSLLMMHGEGDLDSFWIRVSKVHPNIGKNALRILLQFSTTYICEASFSSMTNLKTVKRGSLKMLAEEMQVSLSNIPPNIQRLCSSHQPHTSH